MYNSNGIASLDHGVRKGSWTNEEDCLLRKCIENYGEGNWHRVPQRAGLNRCRKSCRLRWMNHLRPSIKRGHFTDDEVDLIVRLHKLLGNRWSLIAGRIPGRTPNDVKNYWNTHLHKKFTSYNLPRKPCNNKTYINVDNNNSFESDNNNNTAKTTKTTTNTATTQVITTGPTEPVNGPMEKLLLCSFEEEDQDGDHTWKSFLEEMRGVEENDAQPIDGLFNGPRLDSLMDQRPNNIDGVHKWPTSSNQVVHSPLKENFWDDDILWDFGVSLWQ